MSLIVPFFDDGVADFFDEQFRTIQHQLNRVNNNNNDKSVTKHRGLWFPAIDVHDEEKQVVVKTELPGIPKEQIKIDVHGNQLVIHGENKSEKNYEDKSWKVRERSFGKFERRVNLPKTVDTEKIDAKFENGVLEVKILKNPVVGKKSIDIK
jgi:HSP20 family protein